MKCNSKLLVCVCGQDGSFRRFANTKQTSSLLLHQYMEYSMSSNNFKDAKREQTSILAPLERAALRGLARRMPARVNSDHLSLLGLVAMFLAGVFYAASGRNPLLLHLVNLCIFLNWFGDSLDGTLARYRDRQRPRYGFYVDHIIDTFGTMFLILGWRSPGYMTERVAAAMLVVFLMLAINSYLAAYALGIFKISHGKLGPDRNSSGYHHRQSRSAPQRAHAHLWSPVSAFRCWRCGRACGHGDDVSFLLDQEYAHALQPGATAD